MDRNHFAIWLDAYIEAWRSNDREMIERLFSDEARYFYGPYDQPLVGRTAIADSWLADPDDPDAWDATYAPLAIDNGIYVATGESTYYEPGTRDVRAKWSNIFVCRFDDDGRCREFCEWNMEAPKP
jgi:SnoaL-like domain